MWPHLEIDERSVRRGLIAIALTGLTLGTIAQMAGGTAVARAIWGAGTVPVLIGLAISIVRDFMAGRLGVDAVAFVSMSAALALGETLAGAVVAVMYAGGNVLEDYAVGRAERDLRSLIDRAPSVAHVRRGETIVDVAVDDVKPGEVLLVRGGEVIPIDGQVLDRDAQPAIIDEAALTGEPLPVSRRTGDPVRSGTVNAGDTFELRTTATSGESTYAGIVRMVGAAQTAKAPFIRLADQFALLLLPVTLIVAGAAWLVSGDPVRALAVLVAATPCPLILAAPVAFVAGVSRAARQGVLIKGGGVLEALASCHTVVFDKTGTLTVGGARLVAIEAAPGCSSDEVLRLAASLEQASRHVVAFAIVNAAKARGLTLTIPTEVTETFGSGLEGLVGGQRVKVGAFNLVHGARQPADWARRALRRAGWRSALAVFVSVDGEVIGALLMGDELRRETPRAIQSLRTAGAKRIVMVTGDRADAAETMAAALDLDAVLAERVPSDKVDAVAVEQRQHRTVMVGDGINDAPALAAADVGIAMGAGGATASSEAADVVILVDRLDRVSDAVSIARRTRSIALQSIAVGMGLSGLAMAAAAFGWLTPVAGALTQEAIDVAVILNALRALGPGRRRGGQMTMPASVATSLGRDHADLDKALERLRTIADTLDSAAPEEAARVIAEANRIVASEIVEHERADESVVYPSLSRYLSDGHGLGAMSRAHREILHLARMLDRMADGLTASEIDHYVARDAQRVIEAIESLVRLHNAQEEDIYEHAASRA